MGTYHSLVCAPVTPNHAQAQKNHNEMLRCIEAVSRVFIDVVLSFLLQQLESKEISKKLGTLEILKHLITRLDANSLSDRKGLFVSGLKPLIKKETNYTIKKSMGQVIISMANHNYLAEEGGQDLVEFVVSGSSISEKEIKQYEESNKVFFFRNFQKSFNFFV